MWLWMIAAPASMQASASAAISAGSIGTCGFVAFDVAPLIAHSMMTGASMRAEDVTRDRHPLPSRARRATARRWRRLGRRRSLRGGGRWGNRRGRRRSGCGRRTGRCATAGGRLPPSPESPSTQLHRPTASSRRSRPGRQEQEAADRPDTSGHPGSGTTGAGRSTRREHCGQLVHGNRDHHVSMDPVHHDDGLRCRSSRGGQSCPPTRVRPWRMPCRPRADHRGRADPAGDDPGRHRGVTSTPPLRPGRGRGGVRCGVGGGVRLSDHSSRSRCPRGAGSATTRRDRRVWRPGGPVTGHFHSGGPCRRRRSGRRQGGGRDGRPDRRRWGCRDVRGGWLTPNSVRWWHCLGGRCSDRPGGRLASGIDLGGRAASGTPGAPTEAPPGGVVAGDSSGTATYTTSSMYSSRTIVDRVTDDGVKSPVVDSSPGVPVTVVAATIVAATTIVVAAAVAMTLRRCISTSAARGCR